MLEFLSAILIFFSQLLGGAPSGLEQPVALTTITQDSANETCIISTVRSRTHWGASTVRAAEEHVSEALRLSLGRLVPGDGTTITGATITNLDTSYWGTTATGTITWSEPYQPDPWPGIRNPLPCWGQDQNTVLPNVAFHRETVSRTVSGCEGPDLAYQAARVAARDAARALVPENSRSATAPVLISTTGPNHVPGVGWTATAVASIEFTYPTPAGDTPTAPETPAC